MNEAINIELGPSLAVETSPESKHYISTLHMQSVQVKSSVKSSPKNYEFEHQEFQVDQLKQQVEPSSVGKITIENGILNAEEKKEEDKEEIEEVSETTAEIYLHDLIQSNHKSHRD